MEGVYVESKQLRNHQKDEMALMSHPTVCRLAAASAGKACQNATDLVREAVGYSGVFGDPLAIARVATRMRRPHQHSTTPARRAFGRDHAPLGSRAAQRAAIGTTPI